MARILITGASGFIGGFLVARALQNGHEVTAAVRPKSDRSRLNDERIALLELPLEDLSGMTEQLQKAGRFDWVIHNAGVTKALSPRDYIEGNTENTRRLVRALQAIDSQPDKFLFVSSLAALGAAPEGTAMVVPDQPARPLTPYGESKLMTEGILESTSQFPWMVVQPTAVYGPWERDILTFIKLANKGLELTIGRQSQRLSFVHGEDVAGAILHLLENPEAPLFRKYILSDGNAYTTEDLGAAVRKALGVTRTLKIRLPLSLIKPVAGIAEMMGRLQNKPSPLTREKLPELAAENWHCDASLLLDELKFKPRYDLYSGLQNTVDWYRKAGWL